MLDAARLLRRVDRRQLDCGERWLKPAADLTAIAERVADAAGTGTRRAQRLIADTLAVADACTLDPVQDLVIGTPTSPRPRWWVRRRCRTERCGC
ncbi:hypothetical protein FHS42_007390 [Streptomyces zagrosensis]|uniref:Uncharacterized protein n=1 Tax=Streptomyces zagrosensis TaxID=1042984 RepID=A0A7W9V2T2_9ACTN|nr:hypothetical protein [Streptomyces zagrosensis]